MVNMSSIQRSDAARLQALPPPGAAGNLQVCDAVYPPTDAAQIYPGDLLFTYKTARKSLQQHSISAGQRFVSLRRPFHHGCSDVLHTLVVLETLPNKRLVVVDAAGGKDSIGVARMVMNFATPLAEDSNVSKYATYLVNRYNDLALRQKIVEIASSWSAMYTSNFSQRRAIFAPLHRRSLTSRAKKQWWQATLHATSNRPIPDRSGRGYMKVICSEAVGLILGSSSVHAFCAQRGLPLSPETTLMGLRYGPAGNLTKCNPSALTPAELHRIVTHAPGAQAVGYLATAAA